MEKELIGLTLCLNTDDPRRLSKFFGGLYVFDQCFDNLASHPRRTPGVAKNYLYQYYQEDCAFTHARPGQQGVPFHRTVVAEGDLVADDAICPIPSFRVHEDYEDCRSYYLLACIPTREARPQGKGVRHHALSLLMKRKRRLNAPTVRGAGFCRLHATHCPKLANGNESAAPCQFF